MLTFVFGGLIAFFLIIAALTLRLSMQGWIALDQYMSCRLDTRAMADETYSAMCWRKRDDGPEWARRVKRIDRLARWLGDGQDHCRRSYESELQRKQLPSSYLK